MCKVVENICVTFEDAVIINENKPSKVQNVFCKFYAYARTKYAMVFISVREIVFLRVNTQLKSILDN